MGQEEAVRLDTGDMGCGELMIALSRKVRQLSDGAILELITRDPGAVEDIPAWCRLRNYRFIRMERVPNGGSFHFWIQKTTQLL